jgi:two-component system nitrogen regulation sensor histidine kinase NtrY
MPSRSKRNPELNRLYLAAGLSVLIWVIFRAYRLLSGQVETGIDAPSRWALLAMGLLNVLAIGTLLFIVARTLAKLYFERRSGILGARIRTRLVLALFSVSIAPSLMLFIMGRTFIRKNIDRWFLPDTQQVIQDGRRVADQYREVVGMRLKAATRMLDAAKLGDVGELRGRLAFDLLGRIKPPSTWAEVAVADGLILPDLTALTQGPTQLTGTDGDWRLEVGLPNARGEEVVVGIFLPKTTLDGIMRLDLRYREAFQISADRETLETLPQSTLLFLTVLTLFVSVWVGLAIARTISEPVRGLAKAAQRVGTGDLEVSLPEEGEDELALLSRSFNAMTRDLRLGRQAIEAQAERIELQRAYLDQLLEALPVGILSWQEDGVLRTFNPVARKWFGLDQPTPAGNDWDEWSLHPRMGRLPELLAEVRLKRKAVVEELRIGGEGEGRPVRAMVIPLTWGGELAVLEDLSLLAQAETRAAWQEVARRMAHEVKNPLTPIKLTTQRLLRRSREGRLDPQAVAEGAETILAEVASLTRLVDSFSRFAKLPAPQPQRLDASELVRQTMALYIPTHHDIRWTLELPEAPLEAVWDRDMVKRALINMVDNAIGALDGRGSIRVALQLDGATARLAVQDDGPGVPEESRPHLFEPYFSTKQKGTGLGLAIVRRIAQDHHGDARYEPLTPGSLFTLVLPLRPSTPD